MKTQVRITWMRRLGNFSYMLGIAFLIAAMAVNAMPARHALAAPASIWTTNEGCNQPAAQDDNHYSNGQTVHIRGKNFEVNETFNWTIVGQPGSDTPGQIAPGR